MAKGGFRGGMPMGGMNQMQMMKQAQKMQQDLLKMQQEMEEKQYEATAGGGVITAVVSGKRELVRVVKSPEGEITLDFKGKAPGRGAYVCPNVDCLKKARKAKALERGFDCQIPQEVYDALTERMEAEHGA